MESSSKSKIIFLLLGIILGLVVSFVMTLNRTSTTNVALKNEQLKESVLNSFTDKLLHLLYIRRDSVTTDTVEKIIVINKNTTNALSNSYTVADSSYATDSSLIENVTVGKDELLETRVIEIVTNKIRKISAIDSLLADVASVPTAASNTLHTITVEYWQSPINYKGYKMNGTKIVLFGLSPDEPLSITELNNDVFLKHGNSVYKIMLCNDFRSLERM